MIKQVGEDKLVTRGNSGAVTSAFWLLVIAVSGLLPQLEDLWPFAVLSVVGALAILILYGHAETCVLNKKEGILKIERVDWKGKRATEQPLDEIVAIGIDRCYIPNRKRRISYYAYLLYDSGERLELPGVIDWRYGKVLDIAEQVQRFLGVTKPIITSA
jgi:hypothetical protein